MPDNHPIKRKPGAPRGNKNALKHGFYSRLEQEPKIPFVPSSSGALQSDILLYRTLLARITAGIANGESAPASFSDNLSVLQLVCIAVARINSLWRTNRRLSRDAVQPLLSVFKSYGFTDEELDPQVFAVPKGRKGGQPSNSNRFMDGHYASAFSPLETGKLAREEDTGIQSELNLLRVLLLRAAKSMSSTTELTLTARLRALRVFTMAAIIIEKLERHKFGTFSSPYRLDDLIDHLRKEMP